MHACGIGGAASLLSLDTSEKPLQRPGVDKDEPRIERESAVLMNDCFAPSQKPTKSVHGGLQRPVRGIALGLRPECFSEQILAHPAGPMLHQQPKQLEGLLPWLPTSLPPLSISDHCKSPKHLDAHFPGPGLGVDSAVPRGEVLRPNELAYVLWLYSVFQGEGAASKSSAGVRETRKRQPSSRAVSNP